jgi:hypothetical protein
MQYSPMLGLVVTEADLQPEGDFGLYSVAYNGRKSAAESRFRKLI